jgi:hypothetical protein
MCRSLEDWNNRNGVGRENMWNHSPNMATELATYWDQVWDWYNCENRKNIREDEWKHVRWLYDNCNWRSGRAKGTFAVTSTNHGAPIGTSSDPCDVLYKLLEEVRKLASPEKEGNWTEEVYLRIVKTSKTVMRNKGSQPRTKPTIVNWQ